MIKAGFAIRKTYEGQKGFDTDYIDIQLTKKLKPLGPADPKTGEIPYTEELVEIVTKTPIKEVLARDKDNCGIEAYMRPYIATGQDVPDVVVGEGINDFTQFDGIDDLRVSGEVEKLYNSLPDDLKAQYGSPAALLRDFNDAALASYVASKVKKAEEKVVENKEDNVDGK